MWGVLMLEAPDLGSDWDYLVVLDACRYDYFALIYERFFEGVLEKRISRGVDTPSWCKATFTRYYDDIIYVSGNPFINSQVCIGGCCARTKFHRVVDVLELWVGFSFRHCSTLESFPRGI